MKLEEEAINFILTHETDWKGTPAFNPGFDLYKAGSKDQIVCWCEVKAMTGNLYSRPVGLSRRQFKCAQEKGEAYWLYVVEHAGSEQAKIVRIQDPAGKAKTFLFDQGWRVVADESISGQDVLDDEEEK
jgi:hypothetical protein